jgi:hypothetical protein
MSNKSRRIKLAAGAILAGAAIPIAAAGTAWADDGSATAAGPVAAAGTGPAIGTTPDVTPPDTQTAAQLRHEGLTGAEAKAVVAAENSGGPVEVSHDGTVVVDVGTGASASTVAGSSHDVAAAIGDGSTATDGAGDVHDRAFAGTAGSTAEVDYAGHSSATATGGATADINTSATAQTAGASALTAGVGGPTGTGDMHDTATASGVNTGADVELSTDSKAIASATDTNASDPNSDALVSTSHHSTASATGYGGDSGNDAAVIGSSDSKATASNISGGGSSAEVDYSQHGTSTSTNDDNSYVENASHSTAIDNDGTTFDFGGVNGVNDVHVTNMEVGAPFGEAPFAP